MASPALAYARTRTKAVALPLDHLPLQRCSRGFIHPLQYHLPCNTQPPSGHLPQFSFRATNSYQLTHLDVVRGSGVSTVYPTVFVVAIVSGLAMLLCCLSDPHYTPACWLARICTTCPSRDA